MHAKGETPIEALLRNEHLPDAVACDAAYRLLELSESDEAVDFGFGIGFSQNHGAVFSALAQNPSLTDICFNILDRVEREGFGRVFVQDALNKNEAYRDYRDNRSAGIVTHYSAHDF